MIVTAFMPNMKQIENRFDRIDIDIRDLHVGQKDLSSMMSLLEKRMDHFETQVNKRFEQVTGELRDFKADVKWRFEQVEKRFEGIDRSFEQIVASIERLGDRSTPGMPASAPSPCGCSGLRLRFRF